MEVNYGLLCLVPIVVVIVVALVSKNTFMSILLGAITGFLIVGFGSTIAEQGFSLGAIGASLLESFFLLEGSLYSVMASENTVWVILVVTLVGSLIALMDRSGGVMGFSAVAEKGIKNRTMAVISTWILGIIIFFDDYLNCLAVGASMRKITDKYKVSREMLAYIVNSTGVTVCAIIPFSSWSAFMSGQMELAGMVPAGMTPQAAYVSTVPFIIYGWLAVILTPLFAAKIIPLFGPMKKAEVRADTTGQVMPDTPGEDVNLEEDSKAKKGIPYRALNFIVPMVLFALVTIFTEEILYGIFVGIGACLVLYLPQRIMSFNEFVDAIMAGIIDMAPVSVLIIVTYCLQEVNAALGLTDLVISATMNTMPVSLLPVTIFVVIGALSFASGSFWGLAAISFPIVAPLAAALGANPYLCAGALISAVALGGHICLYSDTVILAAASTQTTPIDYFRTSGPLVAVPAALAAIAFLVLGFIM